MNDMMPGETRCGFCGAILPSCEGRIQAAVRAEREACAKVAKCFRVSDQGDNIKTAREAVIAGSVGGAAVAIAAAIRARNEQDPA